MSHRGQYTDILIFSRRKARKGWTLSSAYDMNPTLNEYQALMINSSTNQADLNILLDSSKEYMIGRKEAEAIIDEVKSGVSQWKPVANRL